MISLLKKLTRNNKESQSFFIFTSFYRETAIRGGLSHPMQQRDFSADAAFDISLT